MAAITNELTSLVMLRFLVNMPYLTVGSKKYFANQLEDKRNGQTYQFVVRDAGEVVKGLDHSGHNVNTVNEKKIDMKIEPYHIMVKTGAIEAVTDLKFEDEVAKPNGAKLANGVIRDYVEQNFSKAASVVVGQGFQPLAEAGAVLEDISSENVFGFVDAKFQAILTANGQQFVPQGSPDEFYAKGILGNFHNVEYRSQRFLPKIKIPTAVKTAVEAASAAVISSTAATDPASGNIFGVSTLTLTVASGTPALPKGTPIVIDGLYACDLIGDVTDNLFAFIVDECTVTGTSMAIKLANLPYQSFAKGGTRIIAKANGDDFTADSSASPKVSDLTALNAFIASQIAAGVTVEIPLEGNKTYYCGQLRLDGAMEFETLGKLDASNAETKTGDVEGFKMFTNRVVDLEKMTNDTRFDVAVLAGIVDPRAVVNVYATP